MKERRERRPLQYILGEWEFLGLSLSVGEGVLCPREDTAVLVETLAQGLEGRPLPGVWTCAPEQGPWGWAGFPGPGAVCPCVELSEKALPYLEETFAAMEGAGPLPWRETCCPGACPQLCPRQSGFSGLQPALHRDRGAGLPPARGAAGAVPGPGRRRGRFGVLRAIASLWLPLVKPGGLAAVEIGESQGQAVSQIFQQAGLTDVETVKDWAGWTGWSGAGGGKRLSAPPLAGGSGKEAVPRAGPVPERNAHHTQEAPYG